MLRFGQLSAAVTAPWTSQALGPETGDGLVSEDVLSRSSHPGHHHTNQELVHQPEAVFLFNL